MKRFIIESIDFHFWTGSDWATDPRQAVHFFNISAAEIMAARLRLQSVSCCARRAPLFGDYGVMDANDGRESLACVLAVIDQDAANEYEQGFRSVTKITSSDRE